MAEENTTPTVTPEMIGSFKSEMEPVLMAIYVKRMTRFNKGESKVFVLTGENLYLFDGNRCNRRHEISNISAIIKSSVSTEVVLKVPSSKDLRL